MAISCSCPFCGKTYKLKDELAGKRVTCGNNNCRKVFPVQAPATVTANAAAEAEAIAAAAFADEKPKEEGPILEIDVKCQFCDTSFKVDRAKEGKNVPCPECGKIIKVPMIKQAKPVDWRDANKGKPSLAKQDVPVPEGAWDAGGAKIVSGEALRKAQVVTVEYEPIPLATKVKWAFFALTGVGLLVFGGMYLFKSRQSDKLEQAMAQAINEIESDEASKDRKDLQAGIYLAAGEYAARSSDKKADIDNAAKQFGSALGRLNDASVRDLPERNSLLIELALAQVQLGGDQSQVDRESRLTWDKVQTDLRRTLQNISDKEAKLYGIRVVTRELAKKQQGLRTVDMIRDIFEGQPLEVWSEAVGQIGLELVQAGQKEVAKEAITKGMNILVSGLNQAALAPSMTALRIALGSLEQPHEVSGLQLLNYRSTEQQISDEVRQALAEGLAFLGQYDKALEWVKRPGGNPVIQLQTCNSVARKALLDNQPTHAQTCAEVAIQLLRQELKGNTAIGWLAAQTAGLAAQANKMDLAKAVADSIPEEGKQLLARVEILRGSILANPKIKGDDTLLEATGKTDKPKLATAWAHLLIARQNVRVGENYAKIVEQWAPGSLRPFGLAGMALGSQDRSIGN